MFWGIFLIIFCLIATVGLNYAKNALYPPRQKPKPIHPDTNRPPPLLASVVSEPYQYTSRVYLASENELAFYNALRLAFSDSVCIFTKVRLGDLIEPNTNYYPARNQINQKHIDFVLCRPDNLAIVCAIELDDSTHRRAKRIESDSVINNALCSARIPLIRFPTQRLYAPDTIGKIIRDALT